MRRRLFIAAAGAWLWPTSAEAQGTPQPQPPASTPHDAAVLVTALKDLLTHPKSPLQRERPIGGKLLFSPEARTGGVRVREILRRGEWKEWDALAPGELAGAEEAARDVVRRVQANELFKRFDPKDKRIVVYDRVQQQKDARDPDTSKRLRSRQVIGAYPPGYSQDRQLAIVHLSFPWSSGFHTGDVTYALVKRDGRWVVIVRQVTYYV